MHVKIHPSIKVLLPPWEKPDDGKPHLIMFPNNNNDPNAKKACEIANNMEGNPLNVENKHIKDWATDMWLGVFWQDEVSLF